MIKVLILLFTFNVYASLVINEVSVRCNLSDVCLDKTNAFESLKREFADVEHFKRLIKVYSLNTGVLNFKYKVFRRENKNILEIDWVPKRRIENLSYIFKGDSLEVPSILPLKEGHYLDLSSVSSTLNILKDLYKGKGYPDVVAKPKSKILKSGKVDLDILINLGLPVKIKKITIKVASKKLNKLVEQKLYSVLNEPYDNQRLNKLIEEVKVLLFDYGYYLHKINSKIIETGDGVEVFVGVENTSVHAYDIFYTDSDDQFSLDLKASLRDATISAKRILSDKVLKELLVKKLSSLGYLNPILKFDRKKVKNSLDEDQFQTLISITLNEKTKLNKLIFKGNSEISSKTFKSLFYKNSTDQSESNVFDLEYYKNFLALIKEEYIKLGYVNVFLESPEVIANDDKSSIDLVYRIREGVRAKVGTVFLKGLTENERTLVLKVLNLKKGDAFDPISFKANLALARNELKEKGFYFSKLTTDKQSSLITYNRDNTKVDVHLEFDLGKKYKVGEIIIIGNSKTRSKVLKRELLFKEDSTLKSSLITKSQTRILSTGLFSSVIITPIENSSDKADILISVKEKDYGTVEIAPGIRNDLGPKFSAKVSYSNIDGLDKQLAFNIQVNRRFNLNSLDKERAEEEENLLEYIALVNYTENYLFERFFSLFFDSPVSLDTSISYSRQRFFTFDADIQKISNTLSTDLSSKLNFSLTHELEVISQYNATVQRESGHFQIGSLTPAITLDFRNNRINPTKGSYFSLSTEFANPSFLSQENDELAIDYYKILARNRFYIPYDNGTLALSLTTGFQKNQARDIKKDGSGETTGYIPNIKVFRLSGLDNVRGFEDDEINRLIDGNDISDVRVDDTAYMVNLKVEPRMYLSDSSMLGIFYDAGRIFVNEYDLSSLRSSVGLSFKYLTPVGSLDFDYGIKLLRKRDLDGTLESPGRLHVSIGFF